MSGTREGLNNHQRTVKCDQEELVLNEKECNHQTLQNARLARRKVLAPSYISLGKTPEEEEPLPSILNLRKWHNWSN